ncbi:MAG: hypothetical protein ACTSP4_14200 [Candidatus Hodarchaeales archaeon]
MAKTKISRFVITIMTIVLLFAAYYPLESIAAPVENNSVNQNETIAFSNIKIKLDSSSIDYSRDTHIDRIENLPDIPIWFYRANADLTTHSDILLDISVEFKPDADPTWNNNYTAFKNSPLVRTYRSEYFALEALMFTNISLLGLKTESFSTDSHIYYDFESGSTQQLFCINHQIVITEATSFLLELQEPFKFDLNNIQLGRIYDFSLFMVYNTNPEGFNEINEHVRIRAPGTPLEETTDGKGMKGDIYFSSFEPERTEPYVTRHLISKSFYQVNKP